ncbi:MAG: hypothetical protein R2789_02080 [Microthrixaceae bacterium]
MSDSDGNKLPFPSDRVEYRTITDATVRVPTRLLSGEINALHNTSSTETETLRLRQRNSGSIKIVEWFRGC